MDKYKYNSLPLNTVKLTDDRLISRRKDNYDYLMKLTNDNLMRNYEFEAGLMQYDHYPSGIHGGWENPYCQLRGHFLGHWLSGAAQNYAATGDIQIKAKADAIIERLAVCQMENGGRWAGSIPEKYLDRVAKHKFVWAPQYAFHKTFMGLLDMYEYAGNQQALEIAENWAEWFLEWSAKFTREQFDDILDMETGGMLEIWARMYGFTGKDCYCVLMDRYYRGRLFDTLLAGHDVLTNMHANTTIPEVIGAAIAYHVTQEDKWLDICKAYWNMAVTVRGMFCTGGQTLGEVWTPPQSQQARLGDKNQEFCTVYNMMRLADFLFKVTGESHYLDYYERNLYNGIFAQSYWNGWLPNGAKSEYPLFGLLTYFLPLMPGGRKAWASETDDFFCCHGTLVQANASHHEGLVYSNDDSIVIGQYFGMETECELSAGKVAFEIDIETLSGHRLWSNNSVQNQMTEPITTKIPNNPNKMAFYVRMRETNGAEFSLKIRVPWWIKGKPVVKINGEQKEIAAIGGFIDIKRLWQKDDEVYVELPRGLHCWLLPDAPEMVAFMDGPVVLAGMADEERTLYGDISSPNTMLRADNERQWGTWNTDYYTLGHDNGFRFIPIYKVGYEPYTVYFNVKPIEKS